MSEPKLFNLPDETIDQLETLRYMFRSSGAKMTFSAIVATAVNDYYQKVTEEKMAEKEAQS